MRHYKYDLKNRYKNSFKAVALSQEYKRCLTDGMEDRRAAVPCMQTTFDLRRRFLVTRFDSHFCKCLHCSSKSEIHKIGDIFIYQ